MVEGEFEALVGRIDQLGLVPVAVVIRLRPLWELVLGSHSQPRSRASRAAATRFVTPSFPIASDM